MPDFTIEGNPANIRAKALTMDHIVPLGRGGTSVRGNVAPSCKDCNTRKKSLLIPLKNECHWERRQRLSMQTAQRRSKPLCGLLPCAERLKLRSPTCV